MALCLNLWPEAGSGGTDNLALGQSSLTLICVLLCRGVPAVFWQLSKAVSYKNSCLKEIVKLTAFGKSALILAISSFPKASPQCPEKTSKEACVFPDTSCLLEREIRTGLQGQRCPV